MFNLYQIITGAQGGQAVQNLAQQFNISPDQADKAVQALVPALSTAFMTKVMHPGGLNEIAGAMTDDQHKQAYADPNVAQAPASQQKGGDIVSSIFGNSAIVQQVIEQASRYTGISEDTLRQMLPVIVSIVVGGVATAMHNQGLGGILGQIANSFGGGGATPGATPSQPQAGGGLGGMFGNILSSMLGGGAAANPQQSASPAGMPAMPAGWQAGFDTLSKMFQPGVQPHAGVPGDLGDQISSILGGKR